MQPFHRPLVNEHDGQLGIAMHVQLVEREGGDSHQNGLVNSDPGLVIDLNGHRMPLFGSRSPGGRVRRGARLANSCASARSKRCACCCCSWSVYASTFFATTVWRTPSSLMNRTILIP